MWFFHQSWYKKRFPKLSVVALNTQCHTCMADALGCGFRTLGAFYEDYPLIATFPLQTGQSRAHRPDKALGGLWESSGHAGGNTLSGSPFPLGDSPGVLTGCLSLAKVCRQTLHQGSGRTPAP